MNGRTGYYGNGSGVVYGTGDFHNFPKRKKKKSRLKPKTRWSREESLKEIHSDRYVALIVKDVCQLLEVKYSDRKFNIDIAKHVKRIVPFHASDSKLAEVAKN